MSVAAVDLKKISDLERSYEKEEQSQDYFRIFSSYVQSSSGLSKFFKLLINGCNWPVHFANVLNVSEEAINRLLCLSKNIKFVNNNLILAKYPKTIQDLKDSYSSYQKVQIHDDVVVKKRDKLILNVLQTVSDTTLMIQLGEILSLYTLGRLSTLINFTGNLFMVFFGGMSLKMDSQAYFEHCQMNQIVESQKRPVRRLKTLFHEIKNLDLLNIAKTVASLALNTLIILEIVFKIAPISAGCLLLISTAATILTVWSHFYKESMTYPSVF